MKKLSLVAILALVAFRSTAQPQVPIGADRFIGTYVISGQGGRFTITKEGEHYRLREVTQGAKGGPYQQYKFVRKSDGRLADEKGILGTLTLGAISFEDGTKSPASVVCASFCYTQFFLLKENLVVGY